MTRACPVLQYSLVLLCCGYMLGAAAAEEPSNPPLHLNMGLYYPALNDFIDRKDIAISLQFWLQELTKANGIDVSVVHLYDNILEMRDDFTARKIDLFVSPPLAIVKYFDLSLLADGFYGIREDGKQNSLLLLANSEQVADIQDIIGKRLEIPFGNELAEVFLETITLKTFKKKYQQLFSEISKQRKMNRMILDLFFKRTDVALVYESSYDVMVELNPQIKSRIKILRSYPLRSKNFSYFHRDYPFRKSLVKQAVLLGSYPRGRQILDIYQTAEIGICQTQELNVFIKLYRQYLNLQRKANH